MSEAAFDARDAVRVLKEAEGYEEGLRIRTGGITWMVWGFVMACIWLSYGFAAHTGRLDGVLGMFLWFPWVFAGWLATYALWRSAGITLGTPPEEGRRDFRRRMILNLALAGLFTIVIASAQGSVLGPLLPLVLTGGMTLAMGAFADWGRLGRGASFGVGVVILATAAVLALAHASGDVVGLVGLVVASGSYFVAGLALTLRG